MMRYSQFIAPRTSEVVEAPTPEPGYGEVVLDVKVCGVCASELHGWMDPQPNYPARRGHEPAGVVRAVGAGVTRFRVGDRVTGLCAPSFGDVAVAREADLLPIPDGVAFEHALGEPLACLVNAGRRTAVELADQVALIGLGFMGLGMLQLLRLRGPRHIIAIDPRPDARGVALELGAHEAYHPDDVPASYLLTNWGDWQKPVGVDVAIDASGTQAGLTLAGKMVRAHGILSILGFHQGGTRAVDVEMWNWKAIDVVNAHVRRHADLLESMRIGLHLIESGQFSFAPLISHRFGLDDVDGAFTALAEKPAGFLKAVIVP
jgi:threonine dehydrogenase-like Zn-dependent dehydrogenase